MLASLAGAFVLSRLQLSVGISRQKKHSSHHQRASEFT